VRIVKTESHNLVYALVLAAGNASRFGRTKQLEQLDGTSLVNRAVGVATHVCGSRVALVVGHDWRAVSESGLGSTGFLVRNEHFERGLGTSLALGVRALRHAADAILVLLADQPLVDAPHLTRLVDAWSGVGHDIVATAYDDTAGPPVLFPSGCFDELARLEDDNGGKHLLTDPRFTTTTVTFEPAAVDIDTPADLERL
jgi:molybdenum cofactor cytidylyltransferase